MGIPRRDWFATAIVALATLVAALWAAEVAPPGLGGLRATGLVVLACGFIASAGAVVPGFEQLIHGSRMYLAIASLLGLGALGAGIALLVTEDGTWLAVLTAATLVMWAMSTARHVRAEARTRHPSARIGSSPHRPAAA